MKKKLFIFFTIISLSFQAYTQTCGSLGENIFLDGDFGSGIQNILQTNPLIAPGYDYETDPPPLDGTYTITNNTTSWGSFAVDWANTGDNSDDPNGYMMVVNSSYEPGLFYEKEVEGLCENTLYEFSADVFNLIVGLNSIEPNISYLLDGVVIYSTGDIPPNEQWNTYAFTFTTNPNQTSVTLALQNNAPGGSGNDLAIDNITFRACGPEALILPEEVANICEDEDPIELLATINGTQYDTNYLQWQESFDAGITWQNIPNETNLSFLFTNLNGGVYYYRYVLADNPLNLSNSKCHVISNVKIVHVVPKFYTIIDTLCTGLSFSLKDSLYSETGVYVDSLTTTLGCDSIVTLDLTIVPDAGIIAELTTTDPSCEYTLDGIIELDTIINGMPPITIFANDIQTESGDYFDLQAGEYFYEITDRNGCHFDTLIHLINPPPFVIDLGDDQEIILGEIVEIDPFLSEAAENFIWNPVDLVDCPVDCSSLIWTPINSTTLSLTAYSVAEGCIATDTVLINLIKNRKVYIPNAFSPNTDGINDMFTAFGSVTNILQIERLNIFDRWGNLVFENKDFLPNDLSSGWDGYFKGDLASDGVYVYIVEVLFLDGVSVLYKGDVSLVR